VGGIRNARDQQAHMNVVQQHKKYGQSAQEINAVEPVPISTGIRSL
jgi:hypothetical protein